VYPHLGKTLKRLVKSPKGYLLNNGLISTLTGLSDLSTLEKTGLIGHRLENWFLNELNIWGARSASPQKIFFWQTTNQAEVDFVVIRKPYLYPFEVTYQSEINPSKIKHLMTFLKEEPNAPWAFYIYRGEFKIDHERHIIFIPCWAVS
jgi:predicted AAA+ superfamily ATPase